MAEAGEKRVAPLELFFDLVFVFALTQVTKLMAARSELGLGSARACSMLAALWWAWGAYAWLTNYIAAEEDRERLLMFAVMGAFLVAALAVPHAFDDNALLFAIAYAVARWLHIFIFAEANDDLDAAEAIRRLARTALPAPALLISGRLPRRRPLRRWSGSRRSRIDFAGPFVFGVRGFRVSARPLRGALRADRDHRARRVDRRHRHRHPGRAGCAALSAARCSASWWPARSGGRTSTWWRSCPSGTSASCAASTCVRVARDSYSYLHLPMIAGIVLVALGVKKAIGHVDEPLETVPAVALFGGIALYYAGHLGFRLRNVRTSQPAPAGGRGGLPVPDTSVDGGRCHLGPGAGRSRDLRRDRVRDDPLGRGTQQCAPDARALSLTS